MPSEPVESYFRSEFVICLYAITVALAKLAHVGICYQKKQMHLMLADTFAYTNWSKGGNEFRTEQGVPATHFPSRTTPAATSVYHLQTHPRYIPHPHWERATQCKTKMPGPSRTLLLSPHNIPTSHNLPNWLPYSPCESTWSYRYGGPN
jgi:hypothetical protein